MKPLRYIIAVSVTMFMVSSVFAERSLEFEATPQNVGLYDMIDARILLSSDENTSVNAVSIGGIDNFSVISQGKSTSVQIINGDMQQKTEFQLKLQAKKQGDFVLGPVIIGEGTGAVSASGVTIHVTDIPVAMSSTTSTGQPQSEDDSGMKDIHGVQSIPASSFSWMMFWYGVGLLVFFTFFFWILKRYVVMPEKPREVLPVEPRKDARAMLLEAVTRLKKKLGTLEKEVFYAEMTAIYRQYFVLQGFQGADTMTQEEFSKKYTKLSNGKLGQNYKTAYFMEFSPEADTEELRKRLISELTEELGRY